MTDETPLAATPDDDEIVNDNEASEAEVAEEQAEGAVGDDGAEGEGSDADKPKKLPGSRREKIRNDVLRRENAELQRRLEEVSRPGAGDKSDAEKPPQEADFNGDYLAFERAVNEHNIRKVIREEVSRTEAARRSNEQGDIWRERVIAHQERVEEAKESITDFDQVLRAASGALASKDVEREILSSEKSALLLYHLAKNPEKLNELNHMTGHELAREIGRLEGSVRMPAANRKTNASAPIQPLKGGAAPSFDPSKSSMDDYIAKRSAGWRG